jgi:hypothetical protein
MLRLSVDIDPTYLPMWKVWRIKTLTDAAAASRGGSMITHKVRGIETP